MTTKKLIGRVWLATTVAVALYFVVTYLRENQVDASRLLDADPGRLGAAILTYAGYYFSITLTWLAVLYSVSDRKISIVESASQIVLINLGKYIPGKVWGLAARGARLSELEFTTSDISQTSFLEQVLLLLTGTWLALLASLFVYDSAIPVVLLVITTAAILISRNTSSMIAYLARKIPRSENVLEFVNINVGYRTTVGLVIGFALTWLFLVATFMLLCMSLIDFSLDARTVAVFVLCITAGYLAGFLAIFAPGGVGVREGVGALALNEILPLEQAVFLMLMFRVWVVIAELIAGVLVLAARYFQPSES